MVSKGIWVIDELRKIIDFVTSYLWAITVVRTNVQMAFYFMKLNSKWKVTY